MNTTSPTLLARFAAGDAEARGVFFTRYHPFLVALALKYHVDRAAAEDIAQNICVRFLKKPLVYDPAKKFRGYLATAVQNEVNQLFHRQNRERPVAPEDLPDDAGATPAVERVIKIEEAEHRKVLLQVGLDTVRGKVDPRTWEVFTRLLRGDEEAVVATTFGMKTNAVYQVRNRLLAMLRKVIEGLDG